MGSRQVEKLEAEHAQLKESIESLEGRGSAEFERQAIHLGNKLRITEASLKRRREQYVKIDRVCNGMRDAAEICDRYIDTKQQQLAAYRADLAAARAASKAIKSARSVLGTFSGTQEDWNIAAGLIDDEFSQSLADVDVFMEEIKGDLVERDIDNMVALKRVEDIHRGLTGVRVDPTAATIPGMSAEARFHQTLQGAEARRAGGSR